MGHYKSNSKSEIYGDTNLPQEIRKISNKQHTLTPKGTRKRTYKTQSQQKEQIRKIRAEINQRLIKKKEGKKEKINETKSWFFEKINKIDKPLARLIKKKREGPSQ